MHHLVQAQAHMKSRITTNLYSPRPSPLCPLLHLPTSSNSSSYFLFYLSITTLMEGKKNKKKKPTCVDSLCFFCAMEEPDALARRARLAECFHEMPSMDEQELVLVLSSLWHIAMAHPGDPEFPAFGIFECMAKLIQRGVEDRIWLNKDQNIYIPYYAAHIIGSYTISTPVFAENAVSSGVVQPLMELLRGKMSWVEQRVAVRALGHLVSYEETFESVAEQFEEELVQLCMKLAASCLDGVYKKFVGVGREKRKKVKKYQCDLLTRGMGGWEMENRKAEEWASQLQCWSLYILNCFACKERGLDLICREGFLKDLCGMWGGLVNDISPAGVGLLRILCYSKKGRMRISECGEVVECLCNLSRSSDDWQYMAIDCFFLLLKDPDTRSKVLENSAVFLVDLIELKDLGARKDVGDEVATTLLLGHTDSSTKSSSKNGRAVERAQKFVWHMKVERKRRENMSKQEDKEMKMVSSMKKQQGNERYWCGDVEGALVKYSEALEVCPIKLRKERTVLYSNRAQCYLVLGDADSAISDTSRALCLSEPPNSHGKSLWRRAQAYDMKGLRKESLMDCIMFVNGCFLSNYGKRGVKVPYYAARMINKQMNATWLFSAARSRQLRMETPDQELDDVDGDDEEGGRDEEEDKYLEKMVIRKRDQIQESMASKTGLPTIFEEPFSTKARRKMGTVRRRKMRSHALPTNKSQMPLKKAIWLLDHSS